MWECNKCRQYNYADDNVNCVHCGTHRESDSSELVSGAVAVGVTALTDSAVLGTIAGTVVGGDPVTSAVSSTVVDLLDGSLFD